MACLGSMDSAGLGIMALNASSTLARSAPADAKYSGSAACTHWSSQDKALKALSIAVASRQFAAVS
eukprot:CAMPEP_0169271660 /NCGR_PEP_ID=MMETSP1016-20121227/49917_1 /TAXON_ID=342587 /ORGANISM="Karlodinium micrum, Strain CCMP2283" /LENGTH=65 /DNA_ID=CAMNT_0009357383 /DNA_START=91 /DNA_END=288 /DNA_ORIENTATION=-